MRTFYTSDHHFGHRRICELAYRPFNDEEAMGNYLVYRWNQTVKPEDVVYHLGDFCFRGVGAAASYFERLNGMIYIVPGNHDHWIGDPDKRILKTASGCTVDFLPPIFEAKTEFPEPLDKVVLSHYPLLEWNKVLHGRCHFHGHAHGFYGAVREWRNMQPKGDDTPLIVDVGVDSWRYTPVDMHEILAMAASKVQERKRREESDE